MVPCCSDKNSRTAHYTIYYCVHSTHTACTYWLHSCSQLKFTKTNRKSCLNANLLRTLFLAGNIPTINTAWLLQILNRNFKRQVQFQVWLPTPILFLVFCHPHTFPCIKRQNSNLAMLFAGLIFPFVLLTFWYIYGLQQNKETYSGFLKRAQAAGKRIERSFEGFLKNGEHDTKLTLCRGNEA